LTRVAPASKSGKPITQRLKPSIKRCLTLLCLSRLSHHESKVNLIQAIATMATFAFFKAFERFLIIPELMVNWHL